ncbi:MAG TPA: hypothetical protein VFW71_12820 [Actinomycetota bacterium]|nr:hypothetical protein [Actinomycetota bacterium]
MRTFGKLALAGVAAATSVALLASSASAHECFNTERAAQADASIAAHSHGWFVIQTWRIIAVFTTQSDPALASADPGTVIGVILGFAPLSALAPDQAAALAADEAFAHEVAADAVCLGVPVQYLTLANATAAGGADNSPKGVTADGKGIDHFPDLYAGQLNQAFADVSSGTSACSS